MHDLRSEHRAPMVLSPWDRGSAGDNARRHIVDVYNNTLRAKLGTITIPGTRSTIRSNRTSTDWIELTTRRSGWYKSVAAGLPSSSSDTGYQPAAIRPTRSRSP